MITNPIIQAARRPSKHSTKPLEGKVILSTYSSIKKLSRAMRRDMLPPERKQLIDQIEQFGQKRKWVFE